MNTDMIGNEIQVGDKVKFMQINYRNFLDGTVTRVSPKMVTIEHKKTNTYSTESKQFGSQVLSLSALERKDYRNG